MTPYAALVLVFPVSWVDAPVNSPKLKSTICLSKIGLSDTDPLRQKLTAPDLQGWDDITWVLPVSSVREAVDLMIDLEVRMRKVVTPEQRSHIQYHYDSMVQVHVWESQAAYDSGNDPVEMYMTYADPTELKVYKNGKPQQRMSYKEAIHKSGLLISQQS